MKPYADVGEFPFELTPEEFANACRRAYLRLVMGAHIGWGKLELARWLTGPYRRLTVRERFSEPPPSFAVSNDVSHDERLTMVLEAMRTDVLLVFRELMSEEGRAAFTSLAFDTDLVGRASGDDGYTVIPRDRARMSLVDRALSLVAVDVITRPEDFEHSLFICKRCDQPVFDVSSRERGICNVHVSGVTRA